MISLRKKAILPAMKKYLPRIITVLLMLLANFAADRLSKIWAASWLKGKGVFSFFGGVMKVLYAENSGAFLSMGAAWDGIFKYALLFVLPLIFCGYGIYYAFFKAKDVSAALIIAAIVGGGLGNLYDRFFFDFHVIDFLNFGIGPLRTGILNVADLSVTFGAILLVVKMMRDEKKGKGEEA